MAFTTTPRIVIKPTHGLVGINIAELWEYRELIFFLAWRDVASRYKQTTLGVAWAVLQPSFLMIMFSVFFGKFAKMPSDGLPYPIFSYCAMVPWFYFAGVLNNSALSLIANDRLFTKVYFPRLIIPLYCVLPPLVDFGCAFVLLSIMLCCYHIAFTWHMIFLPLFLSLAVMSALGVGLWLSALNIRYRDFRHVIPFIIQVWMFASPVIYPMSLVPKKLAWLYVCNPMATVIEGFRWCLLGTRTIGKESIMLSAMVAFVIMISGIFFFRYLERTFADFA